jgi:hypothetical protein
LRILTIPDRSKRNLEARAGETGGVAGEGFPKEARHLRRAPSLGRRRSIRRLQPTVIRALLVLSNSHNAGGKLPGRSRPTCRSDRIPNVRGSQDSLRSFQVTAGAPSIVARSPVTSGPSLAGRSLLYVRACVCSGSSFFGSSYIRARPLLTVTHRGISTGYRESSWLRHVSSFPRLQRDLNQAASKIGRQV